MILCNSQTLIGSGEHHLYTVYSISNPSYIALSTIKHVHHVMYTLMFFFFIDWQLTGYFLFQFRDNKWACWKELGIEELCGPPYYHIDQMIADVLSTLHSKLMEAINRTELTPTEKAAINPAVHAFSNWAVLGRVVKDICLHRSIHRS